MTTKTFCGIASAHGRMVQGTLVLSIGLSIRFTNRIRLFSDRCNPEGIRSPRRGANGWVGRVVPGTLVLSIGLPIRVAGNRYVTHLGTRANMTNKAYCMLFAHGRVVPGTLVLSIGVSIRVTCNRSCSDICNPRGIPSPIHINQSRTNHAVHVNFAQATKAANSPPFQTS